MGVEVVATATPLDKTSRKRWGTSTTWNTTKMWTAKVRYPVNGLKFFASLKYSHSLQSNFFTLVGGPENIRKASPKLGVLLKKCHSVH